MLGKTATVVVLATFLTAANAQAQTWQVGQPVELNVVTDFTITGNLGATGHDPPADSDNMWAVGILGWPPPSASGWPDDGNYLMSRYDENTAAKPVML